MLRPFFIFLLSTMALAYQMCFWIFSIRPFIQADTLLLVTVPLCFGLSYGFLKIISLKTDLVERFGADVVALSYFTMIIGALFGTWYAWEGAHTPLYIDNGLNTETTFHFQHWDTVTVPASDIQVISVPIHPLHITYKNNNGETKTEKISIQNKQTVIFNPESIYNYAEYKVLYGYKLDSKPYSDAQIMPHPNYWTTNADYILQAPPEQVWASSFSPYTIITVLTRVENRMLKYYKERNKKREAQNK
jgi:hypothetical protein